MGLFGEDDARPSMDEVKATDAAIKAAGKSWEYHSYPNAGHGFFAVDRTSYAVEAANQGWERVFEFYGRHLS
jgi:carboxymethylenebutenolidase